MAHRIVTAPLVIVRNEEGADQYIYRGGILPSFVKGDALKGLVDSGMVGDEEDLTAETEKPTEMTAESDPGDFSVAQVKAYLESADDAEKTRVYDLEAAGKARTSLVPAS